MSLCNEINEAELRACVYLWSWIIPFRKNSPQSHLAEDISPEQKGPASSHIETEPTQWELHVCLNVCPGQGGWMLWGMVAGKRINFEIS